MPENLIYFTTIFGAAALFSLIGVYARRRTAPMWFWAGTEVDPSEITDVAEYNKENGRMWLQYSLWFWLSGVAAIRSSTLSLVLLILSCTVGIALLIVTFRKIEKKYRV